MELADLKASWQAMDRRVTELAAVNLRLITQQQTGRARLSLLPVLLLALLNIGAGGWLASVFAHFWIAHLETTSALVAGLLLHAASIGVVIVGVVQLPIVVRINYARPAVTIQRYLAQLRAWDLRSLHAMWLGSWVLLPAMLVATAMVVANVDLWCRAPDWVLASTIVGVGGAVLSARFHRWANRPGATLGARLDRLLLNHSIQRAQRALDEIDQFKAE